MSFVGFLQYYFIFFSNGVLHHKILEMGNSKHMSVGMFKCVSVYLNLIRNLHQQHTISRLFELKKSGVIALNY